MSEHLEPRSLSAYCGSLCLYRLHTAEAGSDKVRRRSTVTVGVGAVLMLGIGDGTAGAAESDRAPAPPVVVSDGVYVECTDDGCQKSGGPGIPGNFTFMPGSDDEEIVGYQWSLIHGPVHEVSGKTVTVTVVPPQAGRDSLLVSACDSSGCGTTFYFYFSVAFAPGPVAVWRFADPEGSASAADTAEQGEVRSPLALHAGATWDVRARRGNVEGDRSLALNGDGAYASTSGPVVPTATEPFAVSAWVLLQGAERRSVVVSQGESGAASSGFTLEYSGADSGWLFDWHFRDAEGTFHPVRGVRVLSSDPVG